jgi:hypothetical protein
LIWKEGTTARKRDAGGAEKETHRTTNPRGYMVKMKFGSEKAS